MNGSAPDHGSSVERHARDRQASPDPGRPRAGPGRARPDLALTLVTGPAGSGKTGEVLERFAEWLEREPVLVVPTRADVERFEDELLARRPVALGGRIVTFERLFGMAAGAAGTVAGPALSPAQRRAVLARVVDEAELGPLAEAGRRPGFAEALDRFVGEAQAALVAPADLGARLSGAARDAPGRRAHLAAVAGLYAGYVRRRDALGRADAHSLAEAAIADLRRQPAAWGDRPVLVHGFDDLTPAQLALLDVLRGRAEVIVSVIQEEGRACLAARRRLVEAVERMAEPRGEGAETQDGQLGLLAEIDRPSAEPLPAPRRRDLPPRAGRGLLAHLERAFLTDAPARREPDGALRLLEAAGVRNEVEQVAAAVARLLRDGQAPEQIAVVARSADASAELVEEVFRSFGVPVAVGGDRPLTETPAGRGLAALLRAALTTRTPADLVTFLRSPARASPSAVDRLERTVRVEGLESADEALTKWRERGGRRLWELEELRAAVPAGPARLLERAADIARDLAERPHRRSAPILSEADRADQLAAGAAAASLDEVAELVAADPGLVPDADRLVNRVEGLRVPRSGPAGTGRVEVMTPYRARARQFPYVFVLSLQEGEFPRRGRDDPFLVDRERRAAGLPEPADQRDEERYLFYVCMTRATRRLSLSFRSSDDEGGAATRSFLVDEVLDLLVPGAEAGLTESRGLSATVFDAAAAPSERELARSLAERRLSEPPVALGASDALAARLRPMLDRAGRRAHRLPGPLEVPYVVEQFAAKRLIGASSLELNAECSFRYFVDHELSPRELAPRPEPLVRGGMTHAVLERLYGEAGERPTPATLGAAVERARAILAEEARDTSLDPRRPAARPAYRRMEADIERFLHYDAEQGGGRLAAVEASFGAGEQDDRPPLGLEGFELHGKIDRIDRVDGGRVLIRDYKTGAKVPSRKEIAERKKLQLPLYMLAVRELWGLEPIGGAYHPLGKQYEAQPRGLLRGPPDAWPLQERFKRNDFTADEEAFEQALGAAREDAERLAARIHAGHLDRDPLGGSCPAHCDFHPICRRERGEKNPDEDERRDEENGDE